MMGRPSIEDRFWAKVDRRGPDECWPWNGHRQTRRGYGRVFWYGNGRRFSGAAHRLSWEIANGRDWPVGLVARHSCDNPPCVNPAHITPGTVAENNRDIVERGRRAPRSHCPQGHVLDHENLAINANGWRICRICRRDAGRRRDAKQRAAK